MQQPFPAELFSVRGKSVLITGGAGGIGRMLTETYLKAGAIVTITGRKPESLAKAQAALGSLGELHTLVGDLNQGAGAEALAAAYVATGRPLNVLLNNAGRSWGAPLETFPTTAWADIFAVNVQAPFVLMQGLLPVLKSTATPADPGRIINIGSVYGQMTEVLQCYSYTASKAALHQLTRVLARDLAPHHILVNAIAPGLFPSKMTEFVLSVPQKRAELLALIPLDRPGTPEDIGGLSLFLSSRAGAYVTGAVIPLDGGILVRA